MHRSPYALDCEEVKMRMVEKHKTAHIIKLMEGDIVCKRAEVGSELSERKVGTTGRRLLSASLVSDEPYALTFTCVLVGFIHMCKC